MAHLLPGYEFIWLVSLVDTTGAANHAIDTKLLVKQAGFGAKTGILAYLVNRIDQASIFNYVRVGVSM